MRVRYFYSITVALAISACSVPIARADAAVPANTCNGTQSTVESCPPKPTGGGTQSPGLPLPQLVSPPRNPNRPSPGGLASALPLPPPGPPAAEPIVE